MIRRTLGTPLALLSSITLSVLAGSLEALPLIQHRPPPYVERGKPVRMEFRLGDLASDPVREAYLHYRYRGEPTYHHQPAEVLDRRIVAEVSFTDASATMAEYYLTTEHHDGRVRAWPDPAGPAGPAAVDIIEPRRDAPQAFDTRSGRIEHAILSPEPGARLRPDDVFAAVTFFYEHAEAIPDSFQVRLNDRNISTAAEINPWLITWIPPEPLMPGDYTLTVDYSSPDGHSIRIAGWDFSILSTISPPAEDIPPYAEPREGLITGGQIQGTARSQSSSNRTSNLARNNIRVSGRHGELRYTLSGLITTQEDVRLQRQNQYAAELKAGDWLVLEAGHIHPSLNPFLMAGRRVRGLHSDIRLRSGAMQMQFIYGQLHRRIKPLYRELVHETRTLSLDSEGNEITENQFILQSERQGAGTYARNMAGARIGYGGDGPFGFSVSVLRVEDRTGSIDLVRSFDDLDPGLLDGLDPAQRQVLSANPELLDIRTGDPPPRGNVGIATDFHLHADNNRIQIHGDLAASLINDDISPGILDQKRADNLGFALDDATVSLFDRLSWLIVINENMNALPLKVHDQKAELIMPKGVLAAQTRINLNYFDHNAAIQYQWIGPDFSTLTNTGLRRDVGGYSISDRFRLWSNTVYLTLGHERLKDNVIGHRDATTTTTANRIDVGWYPMAPELPNVTARIHRRTRDNGHERTNPLLPSELVLASVRNVQQVGDEFDVRPSPRDNVTMQYSLSLSQPFALLDIDHEASVNLARISTKDRVFLYGDHKTHSAGMTLSSTFTGTPVRTEVGFNTHRSESSSGLSTLSVHGLQGGLSWDFPEQRISFAAELGLTFDRSETTRLVDRLYEEAPGNTIPEQFARYYTPDTDPPEKERTISYLLGSDLRYQLDPRHTVHVSGSYIRLADRYTRLSLPNHHLFQLRYVYDF